MPGLSGAAGHIYDIVTDYAATIVFLCMVIRRDSPAGLQACALRGAGKVWQRPPGRRHLLLALIAILMVADSLFAATQGGGSGAARACR